MWVPGSLSCPVIFLYLCFSAYNCGVVKYGLEILYVKECGHTRDPQAGKANEKSSLKRGGHCTWICSSTYEKPRKTIYIQKCQGCLTSDAWGSIYLINWWSGGDKSTLSGTASVGALLLSGGVTLPTSAEIIDSNWLHLA